ncbi:MAG TPA: hypothetical protein VE404_00450, partial [Verrucomicrobiae bacterium]|nr:hypothetical protein [Verrucomicrobiae bacterium]
MIELALMACLLAAAGFVWPLRLSRARRAAGVPEASAILLRHPAVTTLVKDGEMVLAFPNQCEGLALNAVAARCWELMDGTVTLA